MVKCNYCNQRYKVADVRPRLFSNECRNCAKEFISKSAVPKRSKWDWWGYVLFGRDR